MLPALVLRFRRFRSYVSLLVLRLQAHSYFTRLAIFLRSYLDIRSYSLRVVMLRLVFKNVTSSNSKLPPLFGFVSAFVILTRFHNFSFVQTLIWFLQHRHPKFSWPGDCHWQGEDCGIIIRAGQGMRQG